MQITNVTWQMVIITLGVILLALGSYNTYATARKNKREEDKLRNQPTATLQEQIDKHQTMLASDKVRIENLERSVGELRSDTKDLHQGQAAICQGVQALLEHELHNGNETEMSEASRNINKWLRGRGLNDGND